MTPSGQYYLDGIDIGIAWGVALLKESTNDFLKYPEAKEPVTHDWLDSHGLDVDLSRVFLKEKVITIGCLISAKNADEWWKRYNGFFSALTSPDLKRFHITEFERSFYIYYKSCSVAERFSRMLDSNNIFAKFEITIVQADPDISQGNTFIITEDNRWLIT